MGSWVDRAQFRRGGRVRSVMVLAAGLALVLPGVIAAVPPPAHSGETWSPFALPTPYSVPGHPLAASMERTARTRPVREPGGTSAMAYRPPAHPSWPVAGTATAVLTDAAAASRGRAGAAGNGATPGLKRAGRLPVWAGPPAGKAAGTAPGSVRVSIATQTIAAAAGIHGVIMSVARADGVRAAGPVSLRLGYSSFARDYGGGWASRLRLVELPACALVTPGAASCRREVPLPGGNDPAGQFVSATVSLPPAPSRDAAAGGPGGGAVVIAATSVPAGSIGNYAATSLKPSGTWAVQQGDFSYSYPVTVPPALGGQAPDIKLSYDSQSIDSETSGQNTQASWIGDGWDYQPGFIERSYKPCSQDGISHSGDECWGGWNATLSMGGTSTVLVRDDSAKAWHLQGDDGSKAQLLTGASNGVWDGEYWLITGTDGTKYYFGQDHLPGGSGSDPATDSAWGVPVYNPGSGDPCYSSHSGQGSWCQMGWRWNLDYVVDPHGNLTVYHYVTETNDYSRGGGQNDGSGTLTSYVRAGYPVSVSYGYRLPDAIHGAKPAAQVLFGTAQRCVKSASICSSYAHLKSSTASDWPDTPYDQHCGSSGSCTNYSSTFWSTVRLTSITTRVLEGTSYQKADSYALTQSFPVGAGSDPVMFLGSITHTGEDGTAVRLPAVTFSPSDFNNRVDGLVPAASPLYRPRLGGITTETGEQIAITYASPACSRVRHTTPASAASNDMPCFPVWWTPPGQSPILDWFNKYLITQVNVSDQTSAGSLPQVTNYQYEGGAAWHQDDSPMISNTYRTWDQYRGYAKVITPMPARPAAAKASPPPPTSSSPAGLEACVEDAAGGVQGRRDGMRMRRAQAEQRVGKPQLKPRLNYYRNSADPAGGDKEAQKGSVVYLPASAMRARSRYVRGLLEFRANFVL